MDFKDGLIDYEAFGAKGDGVTDDMPAICEAHAYANAHGLSVRTKPDATYHLGGQALTAVIATDIDWNTSRFTVDDTQVEDHKAHLFEVRSTIGTGGTADRSTHERPETGGCAARARLSRPRGKRAQETVYPAGA